VAGHPDGFKWEYGYEFGSRPKDAALVDCNGFKVQADPIVLHEYATEEFTASKVSIYTRANNNVFNRVFTQTLQQGLEGLFVRPVFLGAPEGEDDNTPDFLVGTNAGVQVYRAINQKCEYQLISQPNPGPGLRDLTTADLNGDGWADIVATRSDGSVSIMVGIDGENFQPQFSELKLPESTNPTQIKVEDFNGDGIWDLGVLDSAEPALYVFVALEPGLEFWPEPYRLPLAPGTNRFEVHDFDDDSCLDFVSLSPVTKAASIYRNRGPASQGCIPAQTNGTISFFE
jgi:hypothetical protein